MFLERITIPFRRRRGLVAPAGESIALTLHFNADAAYAVHATGGL